MVDNSGSQEPVAKVAADNPNFQRYAIGRTSAPVVAVTNNGTTIAFHVSHIDVPLIDIVSTLKAVKEGFRGALEASGLIVLDAKLSVSNDGHGNKNDVFVFTVPSSQEYLAEVVVRQVHHALLSDEMKKTAHQNTR